VGQLFVPALALLVPVIGHEISAFCRVWGGSLGRRAYAAAPDPAHLGGGIHGDLQ
jgi:hypothetical protein